MNYHLVQCESLDRLEGPGPAAGAGGERQTQLLEVDREHRELGGRQPA